MRHLIIIFGVVLPLVIHYVCLHGMATMLRRNPKLFDPEIPLRFWALTWTYIAATIVMAVTTIYLWAILAENL